MANIVNFSEKQFEDRLEKNIERLTKNRLAVDEPTAFLLSGQPGSGKTSLRTIVKQNDDQTQWLNTWLLDTDKTEKNTKITIRNDFSYQWVDWRNKGQHDQKVGKIFKNVDWDNDLSYEVIGVDMTGSSKNIDSNKIIFIQMHYNDKIGKWQVTGNVGGAM